MIIILTKKKRNKKNRVSSSSLEGINMLCTNCTGNRVTIINFLRGIVLQQLPDEVPRSQNLLPRYSKTGLHMLKEDEVPRSQNLLPRYSKTGLQMLKEDSLTNLC
jgi:hypothetical protein